MAKVSAGVFTCDNNSIAFEVDGEYLVPAELINFEITIDNTEETWVSYDSEGFENALITGKGYGANVTCKRVIGDPCQEFIMGKMFTKGQEAQGNIKVTLANGLTITDKMNIKVTNIGAGGEGTAVAELQAELTHASGKPVVAKEEATE